MTQPTIIVMETTDRVYGVHLGMRPLAYHVRHGREWQSIHGCCGCCVPPEGP